MLSRAMVVTSRCFQSFSRRPLMADYNHLSEAEAIRELARHTEAVKLRFQAPLLFRITSISSPEVCLY
jgi:hypothetical protein